VLTPDFDIDQVAGFEGPEKRLEVDFKINASKPSGLRAFGREEWQEVLNLAKCTIISVTSNDYFDSYVLSESSLFVYPFKMILKTCGTTTLLKTIPKVCALAKAAGTEVEFLAFTRKNYNFPSKQLHPHTSFDVEAEYLNQYFNGGAYIMGPLTGDHWHMYVADLTNDRHAFLDRPDQTLEIMMSELDPEVMQKFYKGELTAKQTTAAVGIDQFLPGSVSDEVLFSPCGYSVNGLKDEAYYTIHVTPEPHCSFVSFETNINQQSYTDLVRQVVDTFRPGRVCFSIFSDKKAQVGGDRARLTVNRELPGYDLVASSSQGFDGAAYAASFYAYKLAPPAPRVAAN